MSKIALKSAEAGTATFTIEAPATNTDRIFELPDEAGKVLTDASDIEPQVKTATNASGAAPIYACRAWVNFAQRTLAPSHTGIRGSGNISSYSRTGEGNYTVNFATAMPDANYSVVDGGTRDGGIANAYKIMTDTFTTSSFRVRTGTQVVNVAEDHFIICLAIFR